MSVNSQNFFNCVAYKNGASGFDIATNLNQGPFNVIGCDSYDNGSHGFVFNAGSGNTSIYTVENCNALKNGGYGFTDQALGRHLGFMRNCAVGSGSMANTLGDVLFNQAVDHWQMRAWSRIRQA